MATRGTSVGLRDELERRATDLGADLFGVASAEAFDDAPNGHSPSDLLPDAKSIIVLAMKMLDAQTDILPTSLEKSPPDVSPRQEAFQGHNAFLSGELDRVGYSLARLLEMKGFKAYHVMPQEVAWINDSSRGSCR